MRTRITEDFVKRMLMSEFLQRIRISESMGASREVGIEERERAVTIRKLELNKNRSYDGLAGREAAENGRENRIGID